MAVQTYAPISRVDIDRLYDDYAPASWLDLEKRTLQLLEQGQLSEGQSRVLVFALRFLAEQGLDVPRDAGDLYLLLRPVLEKVPGGYG